MKVVSLVVTPASFPQTQYTLLIKFSLEAEQDPAMAK